MITVDIHEYAEGAILLDGLEDAIVGIVEEFGNGRRILRLQYIRSLRW